MKKLLLFCSLLLSLLPLSLPAAAETENVDFTKVSWTNTNDISDEVLDYEYCTITIKQGGGIAPKYTSSHVRLYGSNNKDGNYLTINGKDGYTLKSVSFSYKSGENRSLTITQDETNNSFLCKNENTAQVNVKSVSITYEKIVTTTPAEKPEVSINGVSIEDGCFYEISKGSPAEISAKSATSIAILYNNNGDGLDEITGNKGSFNITTSGEYIIESTNGEYGGETLSFTVNIIDPEKTITSTDVWEKVLSTDAITDDGEYILVCEKKNDVASNEDNDRNRKVLPVTITDSKIKSLLAQDAEKHPLIISIKKEGENNYYLFATNYLGSTANGNYLRGESGQNYLKVGAKNSTKDNAIATISISQGNATITFTNISRTIKRNDSSALYGAYASGQTAVQLYKKGEPEQNETLKYSTKEYLDLPDFEHDVTAKTITFTCSNPNVLFEEKHYDAASTQSYAPKAVADGWNAMADGVFDHSAFTNDIILETRAYREDADGNRVVESPIHAMRISASGTVTGIESVAAEAEGEGELFNLQGVRVNRATAAPGLYIERRGGKAVKVIL